MKVTKEKKMPKKALKDKLPATFKSTVIIFSILVVIIIGLSVLVSYQLYRSDYFVIKEVKTEWLSKPLSGRSYNDFQELGLGQNIFKYDIYSASKRLLDKYPELKRIQIIRAFPNRLVIKVKPRTPVAQVEAAGIFLIDEQGIVLADMQDSMIENLPVITGVGWRLFRKVGQEEDSPKIKAALSLLKTIYESNFISNHRLTKIDISDYRNILFFIEDGIEVRIGNRDFKKRIDNLNKTLESLAIQKDEIRYIDLRFDDVVLGTK